VSRNSQRGVVDDAFRVHGFSNLHVCDASVFPTAITVNPQLTVMALAHYAASEHIGR
jgi:choline dehydrogenase-like flavoprotein